MGVVSCGILVMMFCHCGCVTCRLKRFYTHILVQLRLFTRHVLLTFLRIPPKKIAFSAYTIVTFYTE